MFVCVWPCLLLESEGKSHTQLNLGWGECRVHSEEEVEQWCALGRKNGTENGNAQTV